MAAAAVHAPPRTSSGTPPCTAPAQTRGRRTAPPFGTARPRSPPCCWARPPCRATGGGPERPRARSTPSPGCMRSGGSQAAAAWRAGTFRRPSPSASAAAAAAAPATGLAAPAPGCSAPVGCAGSSAAPPHTSRLRCTGTAASLRSHSSWRAWPGPSAQRPSCIEQHARCGRWRARRRSTHMPPAAAAPGPRAADPSRWPAPEARGRGCSARGSRPGC
mmetsp:Transcript_37265/g.95255  ORF Transcript_37265/g.95255 Transcript_37265/m.95255 type:complete len:218 (-) Transcript_37265:683-1336(-)